MINSLPSFFWLANHMDRKLDYYTDLAILATLGKRSFSSSNAIFIVPQHSIMYERQPDPNNEQSLLL
jgi:hypothetical protein